MDDVYDRTADAVTKRIIEAQPAFPATVRTGDGVVTWNDMHLRDYFAAKAMVAFAAHWCEVGQAEPIVLADGVVAKRAYELADAMLAARETKT